ncbi:hypothetical protein ACFWP7_14890 [Streptomyces sp. NPDC058470]|uniref:hypothetical protein n=1 Tax=Streptomyces sp. NPDC058470 TaxID=3346515 RepID=UPI0036580192
MLGGVAFLVVSTLAVGCSGAGQKGQGDGSGEGSGTNPVDYSKPVNPQRIDSAAIPALPIEGYLVSQEEKEQILKAYRIVAKECMAGFGFDFSWSDASGYQVEADDNAANRSRRYGITDIELAAMYGYGLPSTAVAESTENPSGEMSEAANRVFLGDSDPLLDVAEGAEVGGKEIPKGGCAGEAKREVGDGLSNPEALDINLESFQVSLNDEQVKSAIATWSDCMRGEGYDFESPLDPLKSQGAEASTPDQTAMAKADVGCKYGTNLLGVWSSVEVSIQKAMIGENEEVLQEARRETDQSLKNASRILEGKAL